MEKLQIIQYLIELKRKEKTRSYEKVSSVRLFANLNKRIKSLEGKLIWITIKLQDLPEYVQDNLTQAADVNISDLDSSVTITAATLYMFLSFLPHRIFDRKLETEYKRNCAQSDSLIAQILSQPGGKPY